MAPINLPDGSQVSEIVLPDGSTASEVLAPDGSTVFGGIPDSVLEDWERSSPLDEYSGDTGSWTQVSSGSIGEGSNSVESDVSADIRIVRSVSNPPSRSTQSSVLLYSDDSLSLAAFNAVDNDNLHAVGFNEGNNELEIWEWDGGNASTLASESTTVDSQTWYDVEFDWEGDDTVTARLYEWDVANQERTSETPNDTVSTTITPKGDIAEQIGWVNGSGSGLTRGDYYRLRQNL